MKIKDIPEIFDNIFSWIDEAFILVYSANIGELTTGQGIYILIAFLILFLFTAINLVIYKNFSFLSNLEKTEYRNFTEGYSYQDKRHYLIQNLNFLYTVNTFCDWNFKLYDNEPRHEHYGSLIATEIIKNKKKKIDFFGIVKLFFTKIFAIHCIALFFYFILNYTIINLKIGNYYFAALLFNIFLISLVKVFPRFTVPNARHILITFLFNLFFIYIFWNSLLYPGEWGAHHSIIILLILLIECMQYYSDKKRVLNITKELEIIETLEHKTP